MTQTTDHDALADARARQRQWMADMERTADRFFFRANTMLNAINEEMIMSDRTQAMARSNIARACVEAAAYAKREAQGLRNTLPTE